MQLLGLSRLVAWIGCIGQQHVLLQLPAKPTELCRYDRSLWPADGVAGNHNAIPSSVLQIKGLQVKSEKPALGKDSMKHIRQRMATVLDVELCNAA